MVKKATNGSNRSLRRAALEQTNSPELLRKQPVLKEPTDENAKFANSELPHVARGGSRLKRIEGLKVTCSGTKHGAHMRRADDLRLEKSNDST